MNLGYSSSSNSDSEEEISTKKRVHNEADIDTSEDKESTTDIDVSNIFKLADPQPTKRIRTNISNDRNSRINKTMAKVLNDTIHVEEESKSAELELSDEEEASLSKTQRSVIPDDAEIKELNMDDFYRKNQKDIESGALNAERQNKIGDVKFHSGGSANMGRLDRVIRFNINNEEKISFQNKEKIAKEHAIAREKQKHGR